MINDESQAALTTHDSRFSRLMPLAMPLKPHSLLTTHYSLLTTHYSLLTISFRQMESEPHAHLVSYGLIAIRARLPVGALLYGAYQLLFAARPDTFHHFKIC